MHSEPLRLRRTGLGAIALIASLLITAAGAVAADDLQVGQPAPAATLVTLDGKHISTQALHGHTVILTFWATWCDLCREELPLLSRYAKAHRKEGLEVLGFSADDSENLPQVRATAKMLGFPVGLMGQSSAHGYGRIWRIPVSFVIDRDGILRYDGWNSAHPAWTEASLSKVVGPLLRVDARPTPK